MPRFKVEDSHDWDAIHVNDLANDQRRLNAFHQRQELDLRRFDHGASITARSRRRYKDEEGYDGRDDSIINGSSEPDTDMEKKRRGWRDSEGDRLDDFGVDEDVELNDDDIPLAQLLRRRKGST